MYQQQTKPEASADHTGPTSSPDNDEDVVDGQFEEA